MSIKPGSIVEINLDSSSVRGTRLKAVIYDVAGKRLILSQTSPPTLPPPATRPVYISYILKEGNSPRRFGVSAMISGFDNEYRLASGTRVQALIVDTTGKPKEASLRRGYRVRPPRQSAISLTIGGREYAILDISVTGISFIQRFFDPPFRTADRLSCLLGIDGRSYPLEADVIRVSETRVARHVAAVFVEIGRDINSVLGKKILMLEREELSRRI